ncbi:MAG: hypothetical protein GX232_00345 [Acholeplasmataceae bacterium]|nr:hypothetical protein [Acholeplasmataceae bacterium]
MIVIVGASASGKTEIAKILIKKYGYHKCVTTTTRPPRIGEVDRVDYHFLSREDFLSKVKEKAFVEVTNYQNNFYGIQRKDITPGAIVIVDPNGANELVLQLGSKVYLVLVESSREDRKRRMLNRGDQLDLVIKRLESDDEVFNKDKLLRVDLYINNCTQTLEELADIIHNNYQNNFK